MGERWGPNALRPRVRPRFSKGSVRVQKGFSKGSVRVNPQTLALKAPGEGKKGRGSRDKRKI